MAFVISSIPAISAECERCFSQAKKFVIDERNRLGAETVQACQYLKYWLNMGLTRKTASNRAIKLAKEKGRAWRIKGLAAEIKEIEREQEEASKTASVDETLDWELCGLTQTRNVYRPSAQPRQIRDMANHKSRQRGKIGRRLSIGHAGATYDVFQASGAAFNARSVRRVA
jgi:uncharacterized protein YdaT